MTPRSMAYARKIRSLSFYTSALALLLAAALTPFKLPIGMAVFVGSLLLVIARSLQVEGSKNWVDAKRAESGADGEDVVDKILKQGLNKSWRVWRNYPAGRLGDIDFLLTSKDGQVLSLEVKSHRGTVVLDDGWLSRKVKDRLVPFEKDFLRTAHDQVELVEEKMGVQAVVPVLVFTRAELGLKSRCVEGVHVIKANELTSFLSWIGKGQRTVSHVGR